MSRYIFGQPYNSQFPFEIETCFKCAKTTKLWRERSLINLQYSLLIPTRRARIKTSALESRFNMYGIRISSADVYMVSQLFRFLVRMSNYSKFLNSYSIRIEYELQSLTTPPQDFLKLFFIGFSCNPNLINGKKPPKLVVAKKWRKRKIHKKESQQN